MFDHLRGLSGRAKAVAVVGVAVLAVGGGTLAASAASANAPFGSAHGVTGAAATRILNQAEGVPSIQIGRAHV